jgi:hypothetical protein
MPTKFTIKKMKTSDFLFFVAYALFLVAGILSTSLYYKYYAGTPYKMIIGIIILLLIGKELCVNSVTRKSLINLAVVIGLFFLVNRVGTISFAVMFILIWASRDIDFRRIARFTVVMSTVIFVFVVCSSYLGIIENVLMTRGNRIRYYLGFRYALYGSAILYNITTLYLYVRNMKIKWIELFILLAANYWIYIQTDSRLSFNLAGIMIVVCTVLKYFPNVLEKKRILCYAMICSFWICAVLSVGLTMYYNSNVSWMNSLNTLVGGRLALGVNSIKEFGITMFGQNISWHGWGLDINGEVSKLSLTDYNYVDCGYLNVLQHYGAFVLVISLMALTVALVRCYKKNNYYLLILLTFVALHAMIDDLIIYLFYNSLWFVVAAPIEADFRQKIGGV